MSAVKNSVSKSVFAAVHNPLKVPAALLGGSAFDPASISGLRSRLLDANTFTSPIDSKYYLKDSSTTNTHLPRQGRCYTFDGVNDYIEIASLAGSETVVSKNGTASLTISAGRIDATAGTLWDLVLSNGSRYYCNEESGTTAYDATANAAHGTLTNITQATFHTASTSVTSNPNNAGGYRLSGSVYISKRIGSTLAADGNALTVTGRAAYHGCMETPCVTGSGSGGPSVSFGSQLVPKSGDFSVSFWAYVESSASDFHALISQTDNGALSSAFIVWKVSGTWCVQYGSQSPANTIAIPNATWTKVNLRKSGTTMFVSINDGAETSATCAASITGNVETRLLRSDYVNGCLARIADLKITAGGVTTTFPLQDGPGVSSTNRNLAYVKSDGTGGVISNAIVNGTVANVWANRVPGQVKDWCIENGGRIAANGAFIAGMLTGGNAADGSAKTFAAGKFGNPFSRLSLNPATAAELNGRSVPTSAAAGADINATITPTDSAFRRTASDGDDRILIYDDTLSGADLSNVEGYVA